jgi:predicted amidohydrolase YtcJ
MATALTRRLPGQPAASPDQAISISDALDAYTINGARCLGRDADFGSLEVGKSADFVILDRDLLALAASKDPDSIAKTRVVETWFQGRQVYRAARH